MKTLVPRTAQPFARITAALLLLATLTVSQAQSQAQWGGSIQVLPTDSPTSVPQAFPAPNLPATLGHAPQAEYPLQAQTLAPVPSIEQLQAQQQARIHWGWRAGFIPSRELHYLQSLQRQIELQRQWSYADGWLTAQEQQSLYEAMNRLSARIALSLRYAQPVSFVPQTHLVTPMPLVIWNFSGWQRPDVHGAPQGGLHGGPHGSPHGGHAHAHLTPRPAAAPVTQRPQHRSPSPLETPLPTHK